MNLARQLHGWWSKSPAGCWLLVLVLFSVLVRGLLIFSGLKLVHTDGLELYEFSRQFHGFLANGDLRGALAVPVLGHWGGVILGALPFFVRLESLSPEQVSAVFFALPGVINVLLVYRVALGFGWSTKAALLSAALFSLSIVNLYLTRFVLMMDMATLFFLGSVLVIQNVRRHIYLARVLAGALCFGTIFIYHGYWILSGLGMVLASLYGAGRVQQVIAYGSLTAGGFFIPFLVFLLLFWWVDFDWLENLKWFGSTVIQGDFVEGFLIPFEFLLVAEGPLFVLSLVAIGMAFRQGAHKALKWPLLSVAFIYLCFFLSSNVFEHLVVVGRQVRQFLPLLCLIPGYMLSTLPWRKLAPIALVLFAWFIYQYATIYQSRFNLDESLAMQRLQQLPAYQGFEIRRIDTCVPYRPECQQVPAQCQVIEQFTWGVSHLLYRYDAMNRSVRDDMYGTKFYSVFFVCP